MITSFFAMARSSPGCGRAAPLYPGRRGPRRIVEGEEKGAQLQRDDFQIRNHLEVAFVSCADGIAEVERGHSDEQIREWNDVARPPCFRIDLAGELPHFFCE